MTLLHFLPSNFLPIHVPSKRYANSYCGFSLKAGVRFSLYAVINVLLYSFRILAVTLVSTLISRTVYFHCL